MVDNEEEEDRMLKPGEVIVVDYNPLKHMATTHATCINGEKLCILPQVHLCFINRDYFLKINVKYSVFLRW